MRAGHAAPFFFVAQWFPKIAVYKDGHWHAHQYHAASEFFASGYPPVARDVFCLWSIRSHVAYLTRVAEAVQGIRLIERNLPSVIGRSNPWLKMKYFSSTADLFERIAQRRRLDIGRAEAWMQVGRRANGSIIQRFGGLAHCVDGDTLRLGLLHDVLNQ